MDGSATSDLDAAYRADKTDADHRTDKDAEFRTGRTDTDSSVDTTESAPTEVARKPLRQPTGTFPRIADYWPDAPHRRSSAAFPSTTQNGRKPLRDEKTGGSTGSGAGLGTGAGRGPGTGAGAGRGPGTGAGAGLGAGVSAGTGSGMGAGVGAGSAAYPIDPTDQPPTRLISPPPPPRRPWLGVLLAAIAALIFLGGSVVALTRMVADRKNDPVVPAEPGTQQPGSIADGQANPPVSVEPAPSSTAPVGTETTAAANGLPFTSGIFELSGAITELRLTVADLGTTAVQVSTPDGSGLKPRSSIADDTVKLDAHPDGSKGSGKLDVKLNSEIAWGLRIVSGIKNASYALGGVTLRGIDLRGGAARIEMVLPKQDDTIPIRMSGGVNTWVIATAEEAPVKVRLREGGGAVDLNGQRVNGVKRGSTLNDPVDGADSGGLDIDAVAGLGSLTVSAD